MKVLATQPTVGLDDEADTLRGYHSVSHGGEPEVGVVKGKLANGVVRASIPNPRTQMKPFAPPPNTHCDLVVRASDSKMADSNTLKTAVDFK